MRSFFRPLLILLCIPATLFLLIWGSGAFIDVSTKNQTFTNPSDIPTQTTAVIFGAGLKSPGQVSSILAGRLDGALALYKAKKVTKLLLSGDNIDKTYDEVIAMENYVIAKGVPKSDIIEDRKGVSTYDTCYRLNHTFSLTKAVLVTNEYHMPRALYTCKKLGVDVVGLATPNYDGYEYTNNQRESLAKVKMFIDLYIASPKPI